MNSLQEALKSLETTLKPQEPSKDLSPIQQHGSIKNAGLTTIPPRTQAITADRAKQALEWLLRLKQSRKTRRLWDQTNQTWIRSSVYSLPEGMTHESVTKGLTELLRPCSPTVTKHFVTLQAFKPFYDADASRIQIVFDGLYSDVKDFPEVAVVLALDDLRKEDDKYFPLYKIMPAVKEYAEFINDAKDYFNQGEM